MKVARCASPLMVKTRILYRRPGVRAVNQYSSMVFPRKMGGKIFISLKRSWISYLSTSPSAFDQVTCRSSVLLLLRVSSFTDSGTEEVRRKIGNFSVLTNRSQQKANSHASVLQFFIQFPRKSSRLQVVCTPSNIGKSHFRTEVHNLSA